MTNVSKREILTLIGFLLFLTGILSLVLSLIGLDFVFMTALNKANPIVAAALKLVIAIIGLLLGIYNVSRRN